MQFPCPKCRSERPHLESPCPKCDWSPTPSTQKTHPQPYDGLVRSNHSLPANMIRLAFFGALSLLFTYQLIYRIYWCSVSRNWQPIKASVVAIDNYEKSAKLRYVFKLNNTKFSGSKFSFLSAGSIDDEFTINERYRVGQLIDVYVDPDNPRLSVVVRRPLQLSYLWPSLLFASVFGISAALCVRNLHEVLQRQWRVQCAHSPTEKVHSTFNVSTTSTC